MIQIPEFKTTAERLADLESNPYQRTAADIISLVHDIKLYQTHLKVVQSECEDTKKRLQQVTGQKINLIEFIEKYLDPEYPTQLPMHELRRKFEQIRGELS